MTSTRPYLLRAIYEWIVDNGETPHLLVEAKDERVQVPQQFVENGSIVLNVSPNAVRDLELGNEFILFSARFSGSAYEICVPVEAVQAIYARENGQGIFLGETGEEAASVEIQAGDPPDEDGTSPPSGSSPLRGRAPHLKVVK